MRRRFAIFSCSIMCVWLTACADEDAQSPPPITPAPAPTTYVTTNNTYNSTVVYESNGAAPDSSIPQTPSASSSALSPRNISHGGTPRDLATTGAPECDAYLARVETCTRALLPRTTQSDALDRITSSLDTARRAWRQAAQNASARASLAQTCADAISQYNASVTNVACEP